MTLNDEITFSAIIAVTKKTTANIDDSSCLFSYNTFFS